MDGYDKLKPYGICIHGCIDGFSRNIIWLEASSSNNNPRLIAGYFIHAVSDLHGCPKTVRADLGTENGTVRQMQVFLRDAEENENDAFLYGTSRCNQRIESWWGILRKESAQFWMDIFEKFKDDGYYSGDFLDQHLIRFCFLNMIQSELNTVAETWNGHRIRKTKNQRTPSGRPFVLYSLPELCGANNYLHSIEEMKIEVCKTECMLKPEIPCDEDVYNLCCLEMEENGWDNPVNPEDAIELYFFLRPIIRELVAE
ncbi:hypothetical protein FSP39_014819 [Pinctada imbricata]|uniref:Integrase core domain-containing protein n=1 Tax=Pinctada imbricata TaxID=66713 RepID=A0AA88YJC4_PINIB|nr:hypothetical protein FSP39_014819 [Pinctada imbricata]